MKLGKDKIIGLILVIVAVVVTGVATMTQNAKKAAQVSATKISVNGYLGGEKISLFEDGQFAKLAANAGLDVSYKKAGSFAMMSEDTKGMDYLFPSSQAASEYGKANGVKAQSSAIVFNTPIVVYTYRDIADALVKSGIMKHSGDVYMLDVKAASDAMLADKTWADLGYANGYGQFKIDSTDPSQSNSGNEWAALLATVLNGGQPATQSSIQRDADSLHRIFAKSGWMDVSSEDSFSQFLVLGEGSKPMMVGYESQILDLAVNDPDTYKQIKDDLVVAYTTPTVWSTHVFMALDSKGKQLQNLLSGKDVQQLAWKRHGFRGANVHGKNDISAFGVKGIASSVPASVDLPNTEAMKELLTVLQDTGTGQDDDTAGQSQDQSGTQSDSQSNTQSNTQSNQ